MEIVVTYFQGLFQHLPRGTKKNYIYIYIYTHTHTHIYRVTQEERSIPCEKKVHMNMCLILNAYQDRGV
jgi:hypothetical protein